MVREDAATKARRLLTEARLTMLEITPTEVFAHVRGDSGIIYSCGYDHGRWYCDCEAKGKCSHIMALQLVVLEPRPRD
jgi:hypothetical protein